MNKAIRDLVGRSSMEWRDGSRFGNDSVDLYAPISLDSGFLNTSVHHVCKMQQKYFFGHRTSVLKHFLFSGLARFFSYLTFKFLKGHKSCFHILSIQINLEEM